MVWSFKWLLLALWVLCPFVHSAQLIGVEVVPEFSTLRLTFVLTESVQHRYSVLTNPDRVVLDLLKTDASSFRLDKASLAAPVVDLRLAQRDADVRVVLDTNRVVAPKTYRLKAGDGKPERLVLELRSADSQGSEDAARKAENSPDAKPLALKPGESIGASKPQVQTATTPKPPSKREASQSLVENPDETNKNLKGSPAGDKAANKREPKIDASAKPDPVLELTAVDNDKTATHTSIKGRKIVVAIDAGHGGKDTGAIGAGGVREKDVVLAIAHELADNLARDSRYKIVMTRSGDSFIPLKGRRDKARRLKADLFVSVHADAFSTGAASGASVFALSQRGATSEMARFLADQENSSDLLASVGGVSLDDKDEVLAGVLVDLSMTATLTNSLDVGARVLRELARVTRLHNRTVEQAGFMVLKSPDVPSILVETGFISNPDEAQQLMNPAYRRRLAQAIAGGVRNYFSTSGPVIEVEKPTEPQRATPRQVQPDTPKIDSRPRPLPFVVKPVKEGAKFTSYEVVAGDTLAKIALRYGVSQKAIQEANSMSSSTVKTGLRLKIPVK